MVDVCIFYSEPDKPIVEILSAVITKLGWSVWWSKDIKSGRWSVDLEKNIKNSRCVIPIWNSHATRDDSITYAEALYSRKLGKPRITLVSEKINPTIPFNADHITASLNMKDGNLSSECIQSVIESIESVLGIAPSKWNGERPTEINLLGKIVKVPCFVKSLSSHETQLDPEAGLTVFSMFPELDAVLVSAYDMEINDTSTTEEIKRINSMCSQLDELDKRGILILMDSGNYEKSRKNDDTWSKDRFQSTLERVPYTFAFGYDNLDPPSEIAMNTKETLDQVSGKHQEVLLPIIHAPKDDNGVRVHDALPELFLDLASQKECPIIAVPERELGDGICKKASTVINIRAALNKLDRYQPIHILGTGNPLSILILSAAGADFFDGLEWCRTVAERETGFLFHHQQIDFFMRQSSENARFQIVREAMKENGASISLKMGLHNLDFFHDWMEELHSKIHSNTVSEMLMYRASFGTKAFIDELNNLMPGLIK